MKQKNFRPRSILNQDVAGICGVARMTDKARAAHVGEIGSYKYGVDSEQDTTVLSFLSISAEVFQEAAVRIDNDVRLGAWILDNCKVSDAEISQFNREFSSKWHQISPAGGNSKRHRKLSGEEPPFPWWMAPRLWILWKIFKR